MLTETPASKPEKKARSTPKVATSVAFIISVIVHLIVILSVSSVVLFKGTVPKSFFASVGSDLQEENAVIDAAIPPLLEDELEPELQASSLDEVELETNFDLDADLDTSDLAISNALGATTLTSHSLPKPKVNIVSEVTVNDKSSGPHSSGTKKSPGIPRTANIFGRSVTAGNFGAVLDISFSTHDTINVALDEIKKGFPDTTLVLAPGCGIDKTNTGKIIEPREYERNRKKYYFQGKVSQDRHAYMASFFDNLLDNNKAFKTIWYDAVKEDRGYLLHLDLLNELNGGGRPPSRVSGTHQAIEFLINQGCDVIYWMADFNDRIDPNIARSLTKTMRRKNIKLIQHDFDGLGSSDEKNRKILKEMVENTSGAQIIGKGK